ncbi:MAG: hypothetical protein E6L04_10815 [Thaumarchaeota archaeon]|nr:MAG: hypothetical protein E6L04_10815 [Nitrososphaerota archaeon]TLX90747.1 MAG: hypothetical protein E6K97_03390 [Nitrososphaerota archaeon]
MSNEILGKFLLKLYEKTGDDEIGYFDRYEIGEGIGLLDKVQTDHVVENLVKDGFVINEVQSSKIRITEEGNKRLRNNQI